MPIEIQCLDMSLGLDNSNLGNFKGGQGLDTPERLQIGSVELGDDLDKTQD